MFMVPERREHHYVHLKGNNLVPARPHFGRKYK